jgi:hypothetical protein
LIPAAGNGHEKSWPFVMGVPDRDPAIITPVRRAMKILARPWRTARPMCWEVRAKENWKTGTHLPYENQGVFYAGVHLICQYITI